MRRRRAHNPWDLPTLRTICAPYLQVQEEQRQRRVRARQWARRRAILASGGLAAAVVAIVLVLNPGRSARANSIVNEAPRAAEQAGSLQFDSTLTIREAGHRRPGVTEEGAIDFLTGDYSTKTRFQSTQLIERRSVNGLVYASRGPVAQGSSEPTHWDSSPVEKGAPGGFAYETDAFTDPLSFFRALAHIAAPVRRIGPRTVHGVATTLYRLPTNLGAFLAPNTGRIQDPGMYRRVDARLEVWLDREGRPRQVVETFSAGNTLMQTVVSFHGYSLPVTVQAPAKALVHPTRGAVKRNPLGGGPTPLFVRLLFFQPGALGSSDHR
jgi:hypothetical protein